MLSKDLMDGEYLGAVRVCNPFSAAGGLTLSACRLLGLE
jgi:hypothetical protein